jgi:hypothetical protein
MPENKSTGLKVIFLCFLIAMFLCVVMGGLTFRRQIQQSVAPVVRQPPPTSPQRQAYPTHVFTPPPPLLASQPAPEKTPVDTRPLAAGRWQGSTLTDKGFCTIIFEIGAIGEGEIPAYSTMNCMALGPLASLGKPGPSALSALAMLAKRTPHSAMLAGTPGNNGIDFKVTKLIGGDPDCILVSFWASNFGTSQLAVEWKNQGCPGGEMVLAKDGR